jgi:peptidoglycan/xylan/chitin deacetylase (PgdA/CDA1 family)
MTARSTVLAYHAVADCASADDEFDLFVSPDRFAAQMGFLARHRRVVSLADIVNGEVGSGRPAVAITFDDGYRSVLHHALPVLERHGFPATMFVPTKWIGASAGWLPAGGCPLDIMTPAELQEAERRGLSIESHGHAHLNLVDGDLSAVAADLAASQEQLRSIVGRSPRYFAYPFSHGSRAAQQLVADAGFEAAVSMGPPGARRFDWPRVAVTPRDGLAMFRVKTSGHFLELYGSAPVRAVRAATRPLRSGRRWRSG